MVDVLGLHGIGQQQVGRLQMLPGWQAALSDGVERARGMRWPKPSLDLAYYGDVFLADTGYMGVSKGGPGDLEALDDDVVAFLERIQDEVVDPSQPLDVKSASKGVKELPTPLTRLAAWLERRFGLAGKPAVPRRPSAGAALPAGRRPRRHRPGQGPRDAAAEPARAHRAFPRQHRRLRGALPIPDHGVTTLITLGSPFGLRSIRESMSQQARDRLPGLPPGVLRWINIYDPHDAVSLAGGLAGYWPEVADMTVDNGNEPHAVGRYLGKKVTGGAVAEALA